MENKIDHLEKLVDLLRESNSLHFEMLKIQMVWIQRLFDGVERNDEFNKHVARFMELEIEISKIERKELDDDLVEMADDLTNQLDRVSNEIREVSHNLSDLPPKNWSR